MEQIPDQSNMEEGNNYISPLLLPEGSIENVSKTLMKRASGKSINTLGVQFCLYK
jgi:hypothetical protein